VQSTDEVVAYRRQLAELAEEQARLQRSITDLEAKLGEGELVLSLIKAKLAEPA
jgi:phage shock protein A